MKIRSLLAPKKLFALVAFSAFTQVSHAIPTLEQITPVSTSYTYSTDFFDMAYSPLADVTADVTAVDLDLGLGNTSTSGCEANDFIGFATGTIALIQRGACTFQQKAELAAAAGAVGALIFNQGNTEAREVLFAGTLSEFYDQSIPVFSLTYDLGVAFATTSGLRVRMVDDVPPPSVPTPATLALLGLGLAGIGYTRKKLQTA